MTNSQRNRLIAAMAFVLVASRPESVCAQTIYGSWFGYVNGYTETDSERPSRPIYAVFQPSYSQHHIDAWQLLLPSQDPL